MLIHVTCIFFFGVFDRDQYSISWITNISALQLMILNLVKFTSSWKRYVATCGMLHAFFGFNKIPQKALSYSVDISTTLKQFKSPWSMHTRHPLHYI